MDLNKLLRANLKKFSGYQPGEQPQGEGWVKLNTNENPYPPLPEIIDELKTSINDNLRKYPDPTAFEVRKDILNKLLRDVGTLTNRNTVLVGNGSDDILDIVFKTFIDPNDEVIAFYPSYGMYKVLAEQYNAKFVELKLNEDFTLPENAFTVHGKVIFINSPNNPNGKSIGNAAILKICGNFSGIVVVDEAYAEFSEQTSLPLLKKVKNLIVIRTFSKSFSLASLRFGYALADASIIREMNKVKLPYTSNYLAQMAAIACIKHKDKVLERNKTIIEERKRVTEELNKINGVSVMPSDANYILVKFDDKPKASKFLLDLKENKILVRHWNKPGLYEYLRIGIGTPEQNSKFLEVFEDLANKSLN